MDKFNDVRKTRKNKQQMTSSKLIEVLTNFPACWRLGKLQLQKASKNLLPTQFKIEPELVHDINFDLNDLYQFIFG